MRFILLMLLCVFTLNVFGQGIDFFKGNLSEALTKARSENKIVFVVSKCRQKFFHKRLSVRILTRDLFACKLMLKRRKSLPKSTM